MQLVKCNDSVLTTETQEFDFSNPPFDPAEFSEELVKFMYENRGIGLAANQVGVPYKVFAMRASPEDFVCFNPRIVDVSEVKVKLEEGCLSYPNMIIMIERPQHIKVRFQGPNGETFTKQFTGMTARIFQHEMMHLNGKVFFDEMVDRFHLEKAIKKANKLGTNYNGSGLMKYARKLYE